MPSSTATWISRPWIYCSMTVRPPSLALSSRACFSSALFLAMYTPMEEPLEMGFTTTGGLIRPISSSMMSSVTVTVSHWGVFTFPATSCLVRSLSIARAEPRQPEPV